MKKLFLTASTLVASLSLTTFSKTVVHSVYDSVDSLVSWNSSETNYNGSRLVYARDSIWGDSLARILHNYYGGSRLDSSKVVLGQDTMIVRYNYDDYGRKARASVYRGGLESYSSSTGFEYDGAQIHRVRYDDSGAVLRKTWDLWDACGNVVGNVRQDSSQRLDTLKFRVLYYGGSCDTVLLEAEAFYDSPSSLMNILSYDSGRLVSGTWYPSTDSTLFAIRMQIEYLNDSTHLVRTLHMIGSDTLSRFEMVRTLSPSGQVLREIERAEDLSLFRAVHWAYDGNDSLVSRTVFGVDSIEYSRSRFAVTRDSLGRIISRTHFDENADITFREEFEFIP